MKIICENDLCIYWEKHSCLLDSTLLNEMGNCENCIRISLSENILEELRERDRILIEELDQKTNKS